MTRSTITATVSSRLNQIRRGRRVGRAERVGISRATAQRHLATLAARTIVEVRLRYGSTGRPEHRYAART